MKNLLLLLLFIIFLKNHSFSQIGNTFLFSVDATNNNTPYFSDIAKNVWAIDSLIYFASGYLNAFGGNKRSNQIFKMNSRTKEIVTHKFFEGPENDILISEHGGYFVTSDQYILLTGERYSYEQGDIPVSRAFAAKLDKNLEIIWINYFQDIPLVGGGFIGDGIVETGSGLYEILMIEAPEYSDTSIVLEAHIWQLDTSGNLLSNTTLPDTLLVNGGIGDFTPTDDGNFFLSSVGRTNAFSMYQKTLLYKIDEDANVIWSTSTDSLGWDRQLGCSTSLPGGGGAVMWLSETPDSINHILQGYSSTGEKIWTHYWSVGLRSINRVRTLSNGDVLAVGSHYSNNRTRGSITRIQPDGQKLWEYDYTDSLQRPWSSNFEFTDVTELGDGRLAIACLVNDTIPNSVLPNINSGVLLLDSNGCFEPNCSNFYQYISGWLEPLHSITFPNLVVAPSPSQGDFSASLPEELLRLGNLEQLSLQVFDISGRLVHNTPWQFDFQEKVEINGSTWSNGLYRIVLANNQKPMAVGSVLIQH